MRAIRVASAALLGVCALTSCAAAVADDDHYVMSTGYSVMPSTVAAGGQVTLRVDRGASGCTRSVTVSSAVFGTVFIPQGSTSTTAQIDWNAVPGMSYRVTFSCGGVSAIKNLTIAGGHPVNPAPQPPYYHRGVHAGEGGSSLAGLDLKEIGLGAALVAASIGAAYRLSRHRSGEESA
ncbi:hypothetical protein GR925_13430 [Streptomyces sp. HUCO-GS316]|uniref:hypothetical protein n=1 Tax=Streptomyces sp. HUCO-GS316 TaxID=2692198 RepID=UPI00136D8A8C|nr:hypothetical protein [Streptomyces sp. HUCO-GS316]MXM64420.1 hypothetical protein [Streptomyces sp. HUCO-GS316]